MSEIRTFSSTVKKYVGDTVRTLKVTAELREGDLCLILEDYDSAEKETLRFRDGAVNELCDAVEACVWP